MDNNKSNIEGKSNHKLRLFNRENAILRIPNIKESKQFPNPPIKIAITKKLLKMHVHLQLYYIINYY